MWAGFWNGGRKPLPPASPSQAWPYQSLTPPRGLGLLGTSPRGGDLPGRVARGSVAPRKMACRPVRGVNLAVQGHRLALEGQRLGCPSADQQTFSRPPRWKWSTSLSPFVRQYIPAKHILGLTSPQLEPPHGKARGGVFYPNG